MKVKVIPVLEDNYMYLVIEERTREAVAVDVAVPKRLLEIVGREGVSLTTVLTTHHHWDHARGNVELARLRPGLAVLGADERICALTRRLVHGEELRVSARPGGRGIALGPPASPAARPSAAVWGHPRALSPDAGPHLRPHELLPVGRGVSGSARGVLGGCAVGGWLWLAPGEHSSADVREPDRDLGQPASGDGERPSLPLPQGPAALYNLQALSVTCATGVQNEHSSAEEPRQTRRCSVVMSTRWATLSLHRKWSPAMTM
ncbi:hydroxyacylglutathione hydrolase-like protein isoform X5 [Eumetopias jubatus]|uniref:hydroxyacylglutathione hydrolase-like protein isoform X5 n=1 Tax=Eumetopias jubatus TaxID=34886 RepID=UPI001016485D|nr:hydroxyacylglutathione hydrolase-like protein isoform X5 [Eumetopias jubatus]XP_027967435.1 hydroxyacylglutathione hydrolase-like protein isoform X5 [Eumetopias jubatus]